MLSSKNAAIETQRDVSHSPAPPPLFLPCRAQSKPARPPYAHAYSQSTGAFLPCWSMAEQEAQGQFFDQLKVLKKEFEDEWTLREQEWQVRCVAVFFFLFLSLSPGESVN